LLHSLASSSFLLHEYYGHGRAFSMDRAGLGAIVWREPAECGATTPPPCDGPDQEGGEAIIVITGQPSQTSATGRALTSTDPNFLPVGTLRFRWDVRADVMTITGGRQSVTFCGPRNAGTCGL